MSSAARRWILSVSLILGLAAPARAAFDEFADGYSPKSFELQARFLTLTLKGEIELELHDLEGSGGPGYDSPTDTRTIGTRSPFVEIDSFWLAPRIGLGKSFGVYSVLEFTTDSARVGAVWFDFHAAGPHWLHHHVEAGYQTPLIKIDRRSETYPLIGKIYWREPELHLVYEADFALAPRVQLQVGVSLAMMRPLAFAGIQESTSQPGTINVLAYATAKPFSGNGPVGGGRLRFEAYGAFIEGFGFAGRLAAQAGTDVLRSGFANYRDLPGYKAGGNNEGDFFWFGGRIGYEDYGFHAIVEAVASREDLLWRWGLYAQASFQIRLFADPVWFHTIEPLGRYDLYRILDSTHVNPGGRALRSTTPVNAVSWDYDIVTLGLIVQAYRDLVRLRIEYGFVFEKNGVPDLNVADEPFRNNELLVQAELRF